MKSSRTAGTKRTITAAAGLLLITTTASAHDFWLIPNAFTVAPGRVLEVRGQTSSRFPPRRGRSRRTGWQMPASWTPPAPLRSAICPWLTSRS